MRQTMAYTEREFTPGMPIITHHNIKSERKELIALE